MGNWARRLSFGAAWLLCTGTFAPCLHAQNTPQLSPDALKELLQSVHDLTTEVHQLSTQLEQVRMAQQKSESEAKHLGEELEAANQRIKLLEGSVAPTPAAGYEAQKPAPTSAVSVRIGGPAQNETLDERLARIDENAELLNARVADQYQTKVESGAKYRLRLSGIFLLNLYGNTGSVDNQDFPVLAREPEGGARKRP